MPAAPSSVSAPSPPSMTLTPVLPMIVLTRALPVPLIASAPGQGQVLDIAGNLAGAIDEAEGHTGIDLIGAASAGFIDHVTGIVHRIDVIAVTTRQGVGTHSPFSRSLPLPPVMVLSRALPVPVKFDVPR